MIDPREVPLKIVRKPSGGRKPKPDIDWNFVNKTAITFQQLTKMNQIMKENNLKNSQAVVRFLIDRY